MYKNLDDVFLLWHYATSHSSLIIRRPIRYHAEELEQPIIKQQYDEVNIDIEFSGVEYLDIPTVLNGIELSVEKQWNGVEVKFPDRVYKIVSENKTYHIIASSCTIGVHANLQDRLENLSIKYSEILAQDYNRR